MKMKSMYMKMMLKLKESLYMPTPNNITMWWNIGSVMLLSMSIQVSSGIILSMNYHPHMNMAFESTMNMMMNMNMGWMIRYTHSNMASMMFLLMMVHTARGIYYSSYKKMTTWMIGSLMFLMMMMTAFMGYVLPWGQMSFWGATVITNLISAIPYIGNMCVTWVWGGYSINNSTLGRFYTMHFLMPMMIMIMMMMHIYTLHQKGSSNPLGLKSRISMIPLNPYYTLKDYLAMMYMMMMMLIIVTQYPTMLMDPDNFIKANPMMTPPHIKPEWYFLFSYSILRSIPNKLGGVLCLMMSIMILMLMPMYKHKMTSMKFFPNTQMMFWMFISSFIMLTWTGGMPIQNSITLTSSYMTMIYFSLLIIYPMSMNYKNK